MRLAAAAFLSLAFLAPPLTAEAAGTLDKIKAAQTILIGYPEAAAPFSAVGANHHPEGFSIDLCRKIATGLKEALKLDRMDIKFLPVTAENRATKLAGGEIDLECGDTASSLSRRDKVDFSLTTFLGGTEFLVNIGSKVFAATDLQGKKIAVAAGSAAEAVVRNLLKTRPVNAEIVPLADPREGLAALDSGHADALAGDAAALIGLARAAKDPAKYRLSGNLYSYEPYALALRRDDADFRLAVDRELARIFRSADIGDIYKRWFGQWSAAPGPFLSALYQMQSAPE